MDWGDSLLLALTVGFIGVVIEAWSSRNDDLFVRRLSVVRWLVITASGTAVSWLAWVLTNHAWVSQAAAILWAKAGEAVGGWFVERARERQEIAMQARARQLVYEERERNDGQTSEFNRQAG